MSLSLSHSESVYISLSVSLRVGVYLSLSLCLTQSRCVSLSVSLRVGVYLSLSVSLSEPVCMSISVCLPVSSSPFQPTFIRNWKAKNFGLSHFILDLDLDNISFLDLKVDLNIESRLPTKARTIILANSITPCR